MKTFIVTPVHGREPYEINADKAEFDPSTGAAVFTNDDGSLVARELNVSFREKQEPAA